MRVGVGHPYLWWGGSEARALWAIEAFKADHEVALITTGEVELPELNAYYGTALRREEFTVLRPSIPKLLRPICRGAVQSALYQRYCQEVASDFDVLISAFNLCDFGRPAIQCIASLVWDEELRRRYHVMPGGLRYAMRRDTTLRKAYLALARAFGKRSGRNLFSGEDVIVANSKWTADVLRAKYGLKDIEVLYPPVRASLARIGWEEREHGFVCIGRVSPEKRIERMIEIVARVRRLGYGVHLHVIGPIGDDPYGRMVRGLCEAQRDWVFADGLKAGEDKERLLTTHRYAVHARLGEEFGIGVAEMVKAGCIPFVPDQGGPVEIVDHPALTYHDTDDAVRKIVAVLNSKPQQVCLRAHLERQGEQFSVEWFQNGLRDIVARFLEDRRGVQRTGGDKMVKRAGRAMALTRRQRGYMPIEFRDGNAKARVIAISEKAVIKRVEPALFDIEVAMTTAAHTVATECGLFYVPKVLGYDKAARTITLERVSDIVSLRDFLARNPERTQLISQAGKALALIHSRLRISEALRWLPVVESEAGGTDLVPLHGDYSLRNVMWSERRQDLVVLDWASANARGNPGVRGSRYFDLGHFVTSLGKPKPRVYAVRRFRQRAEAFIRAYEEELGMTVDCRALREYALWLTALSLRKRVTTFLQSQSLDACHRAARYAAWYVLLRVITRDWVTAGNRAVEGARQRSERRNSSPSNIRTSGWGLVRHENHASRASEGG